MPDESVYSNQNTSPKTPLGKILIICLVVLVIASGALIYFTFISKNAQYGSSLSQVNINNLKDNLIPQLAQKTTQTNIDTNNTQPVNRSKLELAKSLLGSFSDKSRIVTSFLVTLTFEGKVTAVTKIQETNQDSLYRIDMVDSSGQNYWLILTQQEVNQSVVTVESPGSVINEKFSDVTANSQVKIILNMDLLSSSPNIYTIKITPK